MRIETAYEIGDRVLIDGDRDIIGKVLGVTIRGMGRNITYDVGWMHNGNSTAAWIEEWRLTKWVE